MKITKSQLKKIIKEEFSSIMEDGTSDQMVIEQVKEVVILFAKLYNDLPDDESKELFERYLNENVVLYTKTWQKERNEEDWRSSPDLPEIVP